MPLYKQILVGVGILVGAGIVFLISFFGITTLSVSALKSPIEDQLDAIRSGDDVTAYSETSPNFQNATSLDAFKKFVNDNSALKNNINIRYIDNEKKNDIGQVNAILISSGDSETPIRYRLIKEKGRWKIESMVLRPDAETGNTLTDATPVNQAQSVQPPAPTASMQLANSYSNSRYQFSMRYPSDWGYAQPSRGVVVFSVMNADSTAIKPTITLQSLQAGGRHRSVQRVVDEEKDIIADQFDDLQVTQDGSIPPLEDDDYHGRYLLYHYMADNQEAVTHLEVIYYKTENRALYLLDYVADSSQFDKYLPIAKAMIVTFSVDGDS